MFQLLQILSCGYIFNGNNRNIFNSRQLLPVSLTHQTMCTEYACNRQGVLLVCQASHAAAAAGGGGAASAWAEAGLAQSHFNLVLGAERINYAFSSSKQFFYPFFHFWRAELRFVVVFVAAASPSSPSLLLLLLLPYEFLGTSCLINLINVFFEKRRR